MWLAAADFFMGYAGIAVWEPCKRYNNTERFADHFQNGQ